MTRSSAVARVLVPLALLVPLVALAVRPRTSGGAEAKELFPPNVVLDTAVFAGGCFWGIEGVFEHLKGVKLAESGYAGGTVASPTYEAVTTGETGHAEAVRVVYDPARISYDQLLEVFFTVAHDPTQLNRQGPDVGTQYRSAIYYRTDAQKQAVEAHLARLRAAKAFADPIVTEVAPLRAFYLAEAYHQDYMKHHPTQPYIVYHDAPKIAHLKQRFAALYRE